MARLPACRLRTPALTRATGSRSIIGSGPKNGIRSPDLSTVNSSVAKFGDGVGQDAWQLNKDKGAKISGVNVKIDDLTGRPVMRFVQSFMVGGGSTGRWMAPELKALTSL